MWRATRRCCNLLEFCGRINCCGRELGIGEIFFLGVEDLEAGKGRLAEGSNLEGVFSCDALLPDCDKVIMKSLKSVSVWVHED